MSLLTVQLPTGSEEERAFQTYHCYLVAMRTLVDELYPGATFLAGVSQGVNSKPWPRWSKPHKPLSPRAAQYLRNAWATEVILNSARTLGGADLLGFANHWAPVQAYYSVFSGLNALVLVLGFSNPPKSHAKLLGWVGEQVRMSTSPFIFPWTASATGAPGAFGLVGFPLGAAPNPKISNLSKPTIANAPDLLAKALVTTRDRQIAELRPQWLKGEKTVAGKPRKSLPSGILNARAIKMHPTTLVDVLYRLRIRSNYREADAFLTGALSVSDATSFNDCLSDLVAATLMTIEIFVADQIGLQALTAEQAKLSIPTSLADRSVRSRCALW